MSCWVWFFLQAFLCCAFSPILWKLIHPVCTGGIIVVLRPALSRGPGALPNIPLLLPLACSPLSSCPECWLLCYATLGCSCEEPVCLFVCLSAVTCSSGLALCAVPSLAFVLWGTWYFNSNICYVCVCFALLSTVCYRNWLQNNGIVVDVFENISNFRKVRTEDATT